MRSRFIVSCFVLKLHLRKHCYALQIFLNSFYFGFREDHPLLFLTTVQSIEKNVSTKVFLEIGLSISFSVNYFCIQLHVFLAFSLSCFQKKKHKIGTRSHRLPIRAPYTVQVTEMK